MVKRRGIFTVACLLWMLVLAGCGNDSAWQREEPEEVLKGFLFALDSQDMEEACAYLSSDTRTILDGLWQRNAEELEKARRGSCDLLRSGHVPSSTREYKRIECKSMTDAESVLDIVMYNDNRKTVILRREKGRWVVALPLLAEGKK